MWPLPTFRSPLFTLLMYQQLPCPHSSCHIRGIGQSGPCHPLTGADHLGPAVSDWVMFFSPHCPPAPIHTSCPSQAIGRAFWKPVLNGLQLPCLLYAPYPITLGNWRKRGKRESQREDCTDTSDPDRCLQGLHDDLHRFLCDGRTSSTKAFQNGSGWVPGAQEGGRVHMTPKNVLVQKLWGQL